MNTEVVHRRVHRRSVTEPGHPKDGFRHSQMTFNSAKSETHQVLAEIFYGMESYNHTMAGNFTANQTEMAYYDS